MGGFLKLDCGENCAALLIVHFKLFYCMVYELYLNAVQDTTTLSGVSVSVLQLKCSRG